MIFKRILFYFLSFTGGIIMSFIGLLCIAALACVHRVHSFHGRLYGVVGKDGGGVNLGCFFIVGENCQDPELMAHECGHGLQNIILGPLMLFIVTIPSAIRYGYRELKYYRKGLEPTTDYDSIGFEGQATNGGKKYILTNLL